METAWVPTLGEPLVFVEKLFLVFVLFIFLNKELTYVPSKFYALPVLKTSGTEATLNLSSQNYGHLSSAIKPCLMQLLQNTPLKPIAKACKKKNI